MPNGKENQKIANLNAEVRCLLLDFLYAAEQIASYWDKTMIIATCNTEPPKSGPKLRELIERAKAIEPKLASMRMSVTAVHKEVSLEASR